MDAGHGIVVRPEERPRESFDDPSRGDVSWVTLISGDITPSDALSAGVADLAPNGGRLAPHRHAEPEIYFIIEGSGIVSIDGIERVVSAGTTVFIPGDAEHGIRNDGAVPVRFFYVFPTDRFADVVYRFGDDGSAS